MKNQYFVLMLTVLLAFTSCNHIQEINVDFGGNTYINEYGSLTEAINNLSKQIRESNDSLSVKLGAIEDAVDKGLADAVTAQGLIKDAILSLQEQVKAGQITYEEAMAQLTEAIQKQTADLNTRLAAIEEATRTGLANLTQKAELIKSAIASLEAEVKAGNLSVKEALDAIEDAISSQTTEFSTKLVTIEETIGTGFANLTDVENLILAAINGTDGTNAQLKDIAAQIKALKEAVEAGDTTEAEALEAIRQAIASLEHEIE